MVQGHVSDFFHYCKRRTLRTVRLVPMATQTDPPRTKLCKEVCSDSSDLVLVADVGILTDGNMVVKDDKEGKCEQKFLMKICSFSWIGKISVVMTLSVSQMTDPPIIADVATQTALPRSPIAVDRFLKSTPVEVVKPKDSKMGREEQLLKQIEELIQKEEQLKSPSKMDDSDSDATISADSLFQKKSSPAKKFFLHPKKKPTQAYWNNIDFSDDEDSFPQLPRRTVNPAPSNVGHLQDFRNIIIGQRLQNMRLSPIPPRVRRPNKKIVTWSDAQHKAVSKLISEANALQDIFDKVSMLLGPDIKVHDVPDVADYKMPPSKWDALLSESCDRLEAQLNSYEPLDVRELRKESEFNFS
jgi:hypothetical protein